MSLILGIILILCISRLLCWKRKYKNQSEQLQYLLDKLEEIMEKESREHVQIVTSDETIRRACNTMNQVLDYNLDMRNEYLHSISSVKKMISNVSHDIKTPLTVIMGYMEMLQIREADQPILKTVNQKLSDLLEMIHKFFDLAKLESGDRQVELTRINITEICKNCLFSYYDLLEEQEIDVQIQIPNHPIYIRGNIEALERVLNNLITNAIRYGMDGKYLGIKLEEQDEQVCIQVVDHGKGIPEKNKKEIFERLFTLEDSRSKNYQGSGLGLTITRELILKMNGTIEVNSIPWKRTAFCVTFPTC